MEQCIFCKIAAGQIPSAKRYEDNDFFAFDDIHPKANTHILLVPKKHISSLAGVEEQDREPIGKMLPLASEIARDAGLTSFRLVANCGPDAGQEVDHLHLHILGGNKLGSIA